MRSRRPNFGNLSIGSSRTTSKMVRRKVRKNDSIRESQLGFVALIMLGEPDYGGLHAFRLQGAQDDLFGHNEAITLVEQIILPQTIGSHVNGDKICSGPKTAAITGA